MEKKSFFWDAIKLGKALITVINKIIFLRLSKNQKKINIEIKEYVG